MPKKPTKVKKTVPILSVEEVREIVAAMGKAESVLKGLVDEMATLEQECIFWCQNITNIEEEAEELERQSFLPDYNDKMELLMGKMESGLKRLKFETKNLEKFKNKYNRAAKQFGFATIP